MKIIIEFIKKLLGKEQKKLPCAMVVHNYITIKPFYDRSDSYWQ
jgi:hypothetical protein